MSIVAETKDFASESGHWYDASGRPRYTITGANGKDRATTLRDARKLGLVPSVTTILKMEAAPQLERWKIEQACLACMTLPRLPDESDDAFMARALQDSKAQVIKAAERGTYLHGLLEDSVHDGRIPFKASAADTAIIEPALTWLRVNFAGFQWLPERSFAHPSGFGGKLDLYGANSDAHVIVDYKFKSGIKPDKKLAYDNHCTQLAAYAYGLDHPTARCINLFIDSDTPGLIVPHEWAADDIACGWQAFSCLLSLWKCRKKVA